MAISHWLTGFTRCSFLALAAVAFAAESGAEAVVTVNLPGAPPLSAAEAAFGPRLTCTPLVADLLEVSDYIPTKVIPAAEACSPLYSPATGKVVLIDRGTCTFDTKVKNAQDAGAVAVIVVNDQPGAPFVMGATPGGPAITIPSVMVSQQDGATLRAAFGDGYRVVVTLSLSPCDPAKVVASRVPAGMLQATGTTTPSADRFVLTNLGDFSATVFVNGGGSFYSFSPASVTLPARGSQTIAITAPPAAAGAYNDTINVSGNGLPRNGLTIPVSLVVANRPSTTPGAAPAVPRVDVAGTGATQSSTVTFTNKGPGTVRGLLVGDAPWIQASGERVEILAGETKTLPFSIDRSLRADGGLVAGSSSALLRLIHLDALNPTVNAAPAADPPPLASTVSVVDTSKPATSTAAVPPLGTTEVAIFVAGVGSITGSVGTFISNLSILNSSLTSIVNDLRIYYLPASGSAFSVPYPLKSSQSVNLSDIVTNVFNQSEQLGTIQIRSLQPQLLSVSATVFNKTNAAGTYGTALPAFRSNRSIRASETLTLSGIAKSATMHTNIYVQETSGKASSFRVEFFNESGTSVGTLEDSIGAFALRVIGQDRVPEGSVSSVVTNLGSGRVASYATPVDRSSGDFWFVADWNRFYGVSYSQSMIIPVAGAAPGRNDTYFTTDVVVTNVGSGNASVTLDYYTNPAGTRISRNFQLARRQSRVIRDVVTTLFGAAAPSIGYISVRPEFGSSVTTNSRTYTTVLGSVKTFGTGVPVLPGSLAMGPGTNRTFSGVMDSTAATTGAATGGTFRANVGLLEVAGGVAGIRATLLFYDGKQLSAAQVKAQKDYTLQPYEFRQLNAIAAELLGTDVRESTYGNLDNLELRIETATNGSGAVIPYVTQTDNGTGDTVLRIE